MTDIINSEDEKLDEDVEELLALALEPEAENSGDVNVDQTGEGSSNPLVDQVRALVLDSQVIKWGFREELEKTPYNYLKGEGLSN